MTEIKRIIFVVFLLALMANASRAEPTQDKLKACLKEATDLPDMAEANAMRWYKEGGADAARLCHASAQFNRNEFLLAAKEFAALAAATDAKNPKEAAKLHARSGLSFTRARDSKNAEIQYARALKLEPNDPEMWVDRALERASFERFWDAIADANHAISIMPDMADAIRLRGQCWLKLGNTKNAKSDLNYAAQIDDYEAKGKP